MDQLRTYFLPAEGMPEEWAPGATPWEPMEVPAGFGRAAAGEGTAEAYPTPAALMTAWAAHAVGEEVPLGREVWEATVRVLEEDPEDGRALGALLEWGYFDDSVVGRDTRLDLVRGADGWHVEAAEVRWRCLRGVTDEGLCL